MMYVHVCLVRNHESVVSHVLSCLFDYCNTSRFQHVSTLAVAQWFPMFLANQRCMPVMQRSRCAQDADLSKINPCGWGDQKASLVGRGTDYSLPWLCLKIGYPTQSGRQGGDKCTRHPEWLNPFVNHRIPYYMGNLGYAPFSGRWG